MVAKRKQCWSQKEAIFCLNCAQRNWHTEATHKLAVKRATKKEA